MFYPKIKRLIFIPDCQRTTVQELHTSALRFVRAINVQERFKACALRHRSEAKHRIPRVWSPPMSELGRLVLGFLEKKVLRLGS